MSDWLVKTEPSEYSFEQLQADGKAVWDGVTNPLALRHLRAMAKGDRVLVYHTGKEKQIVGLAEVTRAAYPDPAAEDEKQVVVDLKPVRRLKHPVTLAKLKTDARFADFELVRMPRLSVMPVSEALWSRLLEMSEA